MRSFLALSLVAALTITAVADEKPNRKNKGERAGKSNPTVTRLMKTLQDAGLSAEQMTKIQAAAQTFEAKVKELRGKGLTQELKKKQAEASKAAREAGLKGKEVAAKVKESLSEEEMALMAEMRAASVQMKKSIAAVFTEEQLAALPEAARKQLTTRGGNAGKDAGKRKGQGKGKGKKKEAV
ncbi:hypothetical protein [Rhodopirellula sallentina]|uniref:Signal peptide protein n=1 Tax=Rhodopirellula sallentina SM41 TaxID=1263870 RepID=M5U7B8_9BACT|nr:hypothetical protein [Rhodopirellula sallentina]EMI53756.1 signal peptide protein [Rhodopirellula sallentina SM41]